MQYLSWLDNPNWSVNVILGTEDKRYKFQTCWNDRADSWIISISLDNEIILRGIKLVLGVDALAYCYSDLTPNCALVPLTQVSAIKRISYEDMTSGMVKLFHLTRGGVDD